MFTYVRKDFIDGINLCGAEALYRRFVQRQQLWHFGLPPQEVATFLAGHGWRLSEQAGPDLIMQRYIEPTGRHLTTPPIEWTAYAEKTWSRSVPTRRDVGVPTSRHPAESYSVRGQRRGCPATGHTAGGFCRTGV